jgi:hypothetical protein
MRAPPTLQRTPPDFDSIKKNILEPPGIDRARLTLLNIDFTTDNSIAGAESELQCLYTPCMENRDGCAAGL